MTPPPRSLTASPLLVKDVTKSFGRHPVLDRVSLSLRPGEIFGLIGLNGVGKTTLVKIILDLMKPDSGSVHLFDSPARDVASRQHISYLPEKFQPSSYLTGREHLTLTTAYYGCALDFAKARKLSAALDLDPDALNRRVSSYSKGMGQKLGLVGAMLIDQPMLILDEPMSGLDPRARIRLKQQLLQQKAEGKSIFFSSHILADMDEICDRIAVLHDAVIRFVGTPQAFKEHYHEATLEPAFLQAIA